LCGDSRVGIWESWTQQEMWHKNKEGEINMTPSWWVPKALVGQRARRRIRRTTKWPTWVNFCFKKNSFYIEKKRSFSWEFLQTNWNLKKKWCENSAKKIIEFWMGLSLSMWCIIIITRLVVGFVFFWFNWSSPKSLLLGSRDQLLGSKANTWWWWYSRDNVSWEMNYLYKDDQINHLNKDPPLLPPQKAYKWMVHY
jgi:hypothetical protein